MRSIFFGDGKPVSSPQDLQAALSAISSGNVSTGLDFLVQQTIEANNPARCYLPDGVALIRALAAAKGSEARDTEAKLKNKYAKDFSSRRFRSDIAEAKAELTAVAATEQPDDLLRSDQGKVLVGHENAYQYFSTAHQWKNVLGFNEFTGGIELLKKPPAPITLKPGEEIEDVFDTEATRWLERHSGLVFKPDIVHRTVDALARSNSFHPVKEYLASLPCWDGTRRISTWLADYCGADPGSDERPAPLWFGRMFLISAIARIMRPGCQVDHMLVWEGSTGIGKSSAAKALVPDERWFTDQLSDLGSPNASMEVRGVWIIELAELDAWTRADEKTAKRFISRREERFRQPYGKRLTRFGRQCVFIGTTEKEDWSHSETLRRQWPVKCTAVDVEGIKRDRDLLWAEAMWAFKQGERWHPDAEQSVEAVREQRKRFADDVWTEDVLREAAKLFEEREMMDEGYVSIPDVLAKIGVPRERMGMRESVRVGSILRMAKWVKFQKRLVPGASPSGVYRRPE
jgi:putative DNA primase/helicase